jgi:pSer/pThr/pTyr-binding forkhead associated (FHA) protein
LERFEIVVNNLMNGSIHFDNAGETSTLDEDYNEERVQELNRTNKLPYLIRKNNNEQISIDKPVFTIGKDINRVDYCLKENAVISRRHAEIITKGNHYYICDKGSTNKTYVDNKEIPSEEVVEIFSGTKLKLANEEFSFYI